MSSQDLGIGQSEWFRQIQNTGQSKTKVNQGRPRQTKVHRGWLEHLYLSKRLYKLQLGAFGLVLKTPPVNCRCKI